MSIRQGKAGVFNVKCPTEHASVNVFLKRQFGIKILFLRYVCILENDTVEHCNLMDIFLFLFLQSTFSFKLEVG